MLTDAITRKVTAIVPCAENAVTQKHFAANIIHSYSGTSIEIIDTDAEGRLVLADGISYMIKLQTRIYCRYRYLPVVVLVHWVMNVALCLPIMKPFLKTTRCRRFSRGAPMAITALGCL
jgi:hypothetical protein